MLWPTKVDNALILDQVVLVSIIIAGYDIVFTKWIQQEIHERFFQDITINTLPCMIYSLCNVAGIPML